MNPARMYTLLGSVLSPFSVKVRSALRHLRVPHVALGEERGTFDQLVALGKRQLMVRGLAHPTHPVQTDLDELPLVPFLFGPRGQSLIDSSAIVRWLDQHHADAHARLVPLTPRARFVAHLLDEAFDEVGLYLLHHQRWVVSAADHRAVELVTREFARPLPTRLRLRLGERFAARQVRRLPYLFSVAAPGFRIDGLAPHRQPPARDGFPPTHALLERAHQRWLDELEIVLSAQPFLLGEACSIADLALAGMLGSHLAVDTVTARRMRMRAPRAASWAEELVAGHGARSAQPHVVTNAIGPLLRATTSLLLPLLVQNERAFMAHGGGAARTMNERAFDDGRALYTGVLDGVPFRSVVKTFQVNVLRALRADFNALGEADREALVAMAPALEELRIA